MKRLTVLLLVMMLIFTLAACGGEEKTPEKSDETKPPVTENNGEVAPENNGDTTRAETSDPSTKDPDVTRIESTPSTEASNTMPPVTEPSVTEPPATQPPTTEPPTTEPPTTEPPTTEPPTTEPAETIPETTPSEPQPEDDFSVNPTQKTFSDWKEAYLYTIECYKLAHVCYTLVNIDDDNIPELYMMGDCEAAGEGVYSFKNGIVYEARLSRTRGGKYIDKSGIVYNHNGNMGYYLTAIYKLSSDGFSIIFQGSQIEEITQLEDEKYEISYVYSIDDKKVTEEEYKSARDTFFDIEQSTPFYQNAVDYDSIKNQINNFAS